MGSSSSRAGGRFLWWGHNLARPGPPGIMELPDLSSSILAGAWRGLNYQLDQEKREAIVSCIMITNTATDTHNHSHTHRHTHIFTHTRQGQPLGLLSSRGILHHGRAVELSRDLPDARPKSQAHEQAKGGSSGGRAQLETALVLGLPV